MIQCIIKGDILTVDDWKTELWIYVGFPPSKTSLYTSFYSTGVTLVTSILQLSLKITKNDTEFMHLLFRIREYEISAKIFKIQISFVTRINQNINDWTATTSFNNTIFQNTTVQNQFILRTTKKGRTLVDFVVKYHGNLPQIVNNWPTWELSMFTNLFLFIRSKHLVK